MRTDAAYDVAVALQPQPYLDDSDNPPGDGSYLELIAYRRPVRRNGADWAKLELHRVSRDARESHILGAHYVPFDKLDDYWLESRVVAYPIATHDLLVYVSRKGLTVVGPHGLGTYGGAPGAPHDPAEIFHLQNIGDRVFLATGSSIAEFDLVTRRFRTVVSAGEEEHGSRLEGSKWSNVVSLKRDPNNDALWFVIGKGPPIAHGIWRYDLRTERVEHVMSVGHDSPPAGWLSWTRDGRLLVWGRDSYDVEIDPRTLLMHPIRPATERERRLFKLADAGDFVEVHGDLIGGSWLIAPDGTRHHFDGLGPLILNNQIRHLYPTPNGNGFVGLFSNDDYAHQLIKFVRNTQD